MPRKYKRKEGVRARLVSWTSEQLQSAFDEIDKGELGLNEICRRFGIPSRTLRRRYAIKNKTVLTLGKHPTLGFQNEKRLVAHILKLGEAGFPPDRQSIRKLAYHFAEKLQIKHKFSHDDQMAGKEWLRSFLDRNSELSVRQAEELSIARAKGLNREEVSNFYKLLSKVLIENDLLDKPERIFNMDESGVQLNNKPGKVITRKGTKVVNSVTSTEKGETMTVVACCNAIGNFLPPVIIIKGVNKKPEFEEGLPLGSKVYMNKKSAYINTDLFFKWLTEHFITHKPQGKVLLILDGHSSHLSAPDMLQFASNNDIILLCLPSHTTSALQPLDVAVFGPFKTYFNYETNHFMRTNPNKKICRYNSGALIRNAWIRATTPANAISGFRRSGIYPLNSNAIPDSVFAISDIANCNEYNPDQPCESTSSLHIQTIAEIHENAEHHEHDEVDQGTQTPVTENPLVLQIQTTAEIHENAAPHEHEEVYHCTQTPVTENPTVLQIQTTAEIHVNAEPHSHENDEIYRRTQTPVPMPSTSYNLESPSLLIDPEFFTDISMVDIGNETIMEILDITKENETPSKFLIEASPIPKIPLTLAKRTKQIADILNSEEKIKEKRETAENKKKKLESKTKKTEATKKSGTFKKNNKKTKDYININKNKRVNKLKAINREIENNLTDCSDKENYYYSEVNKGRESLKRQIIYSFSSEDGDLFSFNSPNAKGKKTKGIPVKKSKNNNKEKTDRTENICIECFDDYSETKSTSDWIQCIMCQKWLHETCTIFKNFCSRCGKLKAMSGSA